VQTVTDQVLARIRRTVLACQAALLLVGTKRSLSWPGWVRLRLFGGMLDRSRAASTVEWLTSVSRAIWRADKCRPV